jgi:hypothetical protein
MSHGEPTPNDVERLREIVKARLSQRNCLALIATLCGAPVPVIAAVTGYFSGWTLLAFLLSGGVGMLIWQLNPWRGPRVRCPVCGEDWEHDEFLGWQQCKQCGLRLPAGAT